MFARFNKSPCIAAKYRSEQDWFLYRTEYFYKSRFSFSIFRFAFARWIVKSCKRELWCYSVLSHAGPFLAFKYLFILLVNYKSKVMKKKNLVCVSALCALMSFSFVSCDDDNEPSLNIPNVSVTNVSFTDENPEALKVSGSIRGTINHVLCYIVNRRRSCPI